MRRIWLLIEDELYAVHELVGVVGLEDEVVGPALQPADDIVRIGQRGDEHHRHVAQAGIGLDAAAQLVAVHLRHDHVADDERRFGSLRCFESEPSVRGDRDLVALPLQDVLQPLRLGRAVLGDQYVQRRTARSHVHAPISPAGKRPSPTRATRAPAILSAANI